MSVFLLRLLLLRWIFVFGPQHYVRLGGWRCASLPNGVMERLTSAFVVLATIKTT